MVFLNYHQVSFDSAKFPKLRVLFVLNVTETKKVIAFLCHLFQVNPPNEVFHSSSEPVVLVQTVNPPIFNFLHGSRREREERDCAVHLLCNRCALNPWAWPHTCWEMKESRELYWGLTFFWTNMKILPVFNAGFHSDCGWAEVGVWLVLGSGLNCFMEMVEGKLPWFHVHIYSHTPVFVIPLWS